jgi:hypothetical protein
VKVVENSFFHMHVAADKSLPVPCGGYDTVTSTPAEARGIKVAAGGTATRDFKLDSISCVPVK